MLLCRVSCTSFLLAQKYSSDSVFNGIAMEGLCSEGPSATPSQNSVCASFQFSPHLFPLPGPPTPIVLPVFPFNPGQTVVRKLQYQLEHLGFIKSFADELKLIFHLIPQVIRSELVTFSGHKAPGMF